MAYRSLALTHPGSDATRSLAMDSKPMNAHLCSAVWPLRSAVAAGVPLARHCCTRCRLPPSAASSRRQAALSGNSGRANKPRPVLPAARARSARMAAASRSGETCDVCMLSSRHCALKNALERWNAVLCQRSSEKRCAGGKVDHVFLCSGCLPGACRLTNWLTFAHIKQLSASSLSPLTHCATNEQQVPCMRGPSKSHEEELLLGCIWAHAPAHAAVR